MNGAGGASCPSLAEVNGVRYAVSVARGSLVTERDLTPFAPIARTNVPSYFTAQTAFQIGDISPTSLLAAPAARVFNEDDSPYRILWGPESESAFPEACRYFNADEQNLLDACRPAAPSGT